MEEGEGGQEEGREEEEGGRNGGRSIRAEGASEVTLQSPEQWDSGRWRENTVSRSAHGGRARRLSSVTLSFLVAYTEG